MNLVAAAVEMEISKAHLRHLVQDRSRAKRRYADWQHEYYMTEHFVRDTKGKKNVRFGNFPYTIADWRVDGWKRRRDLRLVSAPARRGRAADLHRQLKDLGVDCEPGRSTR